jgi:hypothetical protein
MAITGDGTTRVGIVGERTAGIIGAGTLGIIGNRTRGTNGNGTHGIGGTSGNGTRGIDGTAGIVDNALLSGSLPKALHLQKRCIKRICHGQAKPGRGPAREPCRG